MYMNAAIVYLSSCRQHLVFLLSSDSEDGDFGWKFQA